MDAASAKIQIGKIKRSLGVAKSLLLAAALVEGLLLLKPLYRWDPQLLGHIALLSGVLGAWGFIAAWRQLSKLTIDLPDTSVLRRMGYRAEAAIKAKFCVAFFVPVVNLAMIAWAYSKASDAVRGLDQWQADTAQLGQMSDRRSRLRSGY
jgi:hypothetical protein